MTRPKLVRREDGAVAHVATCPSAGGRTRPWPWADTRSSGAIARQMRFLDIRTCRRCKPISALARWEREQRAGVGS